jgi:hypothetical protein
MERHRPTQRAERDRQPKLAATMRTLEEGVNAVLVSESFVCYRDGMHRVHHRHHDSFGNVALILFQRSRATCVAGDWRWKELNRHGRTGEQGIRILVHHNTTVFDAHRAVKRRVHVSAHAAANHHGWYVRHDAEMIAEDAADVVIAYGGIPSDASSVASIAGWAKDHKVPKRNLAGAQQTAHLMITGNASVAPVEDLECIETSPRPRPTSTHGSLPRGGEGVCEVSIKSS